MYTLFLNLLLIFSKFLFIFFCLVYLKSISNVMALVGRIDHPPSPPLEVVLTVLISGWRGGGGPFSNPSITALVGGLWSKFKQAATAGAVAAHYKPRRKQVHNTLWPTHLPPPRHTHAGGWCASDLMRNYALRCRVCASTGHKILCCAECVCSRETYAQTYAHRQDVWWQECLWTGATKEMNR